jgi:hypothetical protein
MVMRYLSLPCLLLCSLLLCDGSTLIDRTGDCGCVRINSSRAEMPLYLEKELYEGDSENTPDSIPYLFQISPFSNIGTCSLYVPLAHTPHP